MQYIAIALAIGLATIGSGIAMGLGANQAYTAIGRNPEAERLIRTNFILGTIFAETLAIYGLVLAILLLLFHQS
ncbi:hypothetical protein EPA93_32165 [Ktedonosporobacter rubrisoli]|uniref:ATP synthase subunit c n=1 Tax=Ktedonosporobacter rubrisoli TaxID=2509675 RepID=A0A4P6JXA5_KTERU|nr:ATP synthase F0 subunit C [Ktedonosporobacter rubrisoli]QBD80378.1 hypothetical protein EPA93_32165 [Ktedonosporobacter rubrisoli]